ncbi:hypothetical protein J1N35_022779 [Gossypium stocksii]|uniref:Uncharacterized protein n=1 Tax=Gossypium stocksii TaxID=47602 RepID=A0A9D4A2J6_9ROSI|nr:hypothetical protein J1N35_022779 [Gossypium stocksii]
MEKGDSSGKKMTTNKTTGFDHVISTPKFKRRKVSVVRDFLPRCGRGATTNLELNRQIAVDQAKLQVERPSLEQSIEELKAELIKVEAKNSVVRVVN